MGRAGACGPCVRRACVRGGRGHGAVAAPSSEQPAPERNHHVRAWRPGRQRTTLEVLLVEVLLHLLAGAGIDDALAHLGGSLHQGHADGAQLPARREERHHLRFCECARRRGRERVSVSGRLAREARRSGIVHRAVAVEGGMVRRSAARSQRPGARAHPCSSVACGSTAAQTTNKSWRSSVERSLRARLSEVNPQHTSAPLLARAKQHHGVGLGGEARAGSLAMRKFHTPRRSG